MVLFLLKNQPKTYWENLMQQRSCRRDCISAWTENSTTSVTHTRLHNADQKRHVFQCREN